MEVKGSTGGRPSNSVAEIMRPFMIRTQGSSAYMKSLIREIKGITAEDISTGIRKEYIEVRFVKDNGHMSAKAYTYLARAGRAKVGDIVLVPTADKFTYAKVEKINAPSKSFAKTADAVIIKTGETR